MPMGFSTTGSTPTLFPLLFLVWLKYNFVMDPDLNNSPQNSGSVSTAEALADLNEEIANSGQPQNTQEIPALDPGFENLSFSQKLEQLDPNHKNTGGNSLADFGKTGVTGKFNSPVNKVSFYLVPEKGAITDDFHNLTKEVRAGVYESVSSAIDDLQSVNDQEALKQLKGKLRLAANPGIFFENGQLKIGPGVSKEEIINFVKQKSIEEEEQNGGAQPNPDAEPDLPSQEEITEPEDQEDFDLTSIDGELLEKLSSLGVRVEKVEALPSLAIYDEGEKILKVRRDANVEFVNEYIKNAVLSEQDGVDQLDPNEDRSDFIKLEDEEEEEKKQVGPEPGMSSQETNAVGELEKMGFKVSSQPVFNEKTSKYEEKPIDLATAEKVLEALKILNISSVDHIHINRIIIGASNTFLGRNLVNESIRDLFVSPSIEPEELVEFIPFAMEQLDKEPLKRNVGFHDFKEKTAEQKLSDLGHLQRIEEEDVGARPDQYRNEEPERIDYDPNNEDPKILLDRLRVAVVGITDDYNKGKVTLEYLKQVQENYFIARDRVKQQIREKVINEENGNLTQEELEKKINDALFEELVRREHDERINAKRQAREENLTDKAAEMVKNLLATKTVKWYLGLSRKQRFALNFGVGTVAGLTFGAGAGAFGALGFVGKRVASGAAGVAAGEWTGKRWSIEKLNEDERRDIEDLKNSNLSLEEKSKRFLSIQQKYKKERIKMAAKRVGVTALAGAGTGLLANFAENFATSTIEGTGGSPTLETEQRGRLDQNRLYRNAPKFSQEPVGPKSDAASTMDQSLKSPNSQDLAAVEPKVKAQIQELNESQVGQSEPTKPEVAETPVGEGAEVSESVTPKASEKPEVSPVPETEIASTPKTSAPESIPPLKPETLIHQVKAGDSVWKMLKETLENNDKFKNLSGAGSLQEIADQIEAKQTRVLQSLVDEVLKNNEKYGIGSNGEISVGQKVDFSNLFADSKKLEALLNEAENLKPAQITSIIDSNHKIETWLSENPGKQLDLDEIVNQKPKVFEMPKTEPAVPELPDAPEMEPSPISVSEELEKLKPVSPEAPFQDIETPKSQPEPERVRLRLAQNEVVDPQAKLAANEEVIRAKRELGILEDGRERLRTMSSDTSVVAKTAEINEAVNQVFNNEIDNIYGESHLLGLQKIAGVATKEWKTISGLPARRVLEYFKSPETSDLPQTILQELQTSEKHRKLVEWVADLVEEAHKHSNADFKPYDNGENMESYIKRIGGFLMRQQSQPPVLDKKLA